MNQRDFQEAKATFQYTRIFNERKPFHKLRKDFVKKFTVDKISKMKLDDYVQGKQNKESFCYGVEWLLDPLGKIVGSNCSKFGIYYSEKDQEYRFVSRFGDDYKSTFKCIKDEILDLLDAGVLKKNMKELKKICSLRCLRVRSYPSIILKSI